MDHVWTDFCNIMERRIGAENMEIWVWSGAIRLAGVASGEVHVRADTKYSYDWIKDNLFEDIEASFREALGRPVNLDLDFDGAAIGNASRRQGAGSPAARPPRPASQLDRSMTFDSFVVGTCNEFAHAAALAVADSPGAGHNPLFIYGGVGLGKTHLMHAIGNRVALSQPGLGVHYLTGQQFLDGMVRSFQDKTHQEFRDRFSFEVDVLLLDDVQFIAGRDRTQEEVFYIFELMRSAGKQIVLAADHPPQEIGKLEPRLRTRFACGLIADVQPPDVETMTAILAKKADAMHLSLPSDVQYAIAQRVRNNVRELEGVINRLGALHNFYARPITMSFLQERMAEVLPPEAPPPTADVIIHRVAEHYHIRPTDIRGDRRPQNIAHPRQLAMYLARTVSHLSFPEIGRAFERDNSTVQYACKKVAGEVRKDPNLKAEVALLERIVRGAT
jgi:chromosomal replication initiator protein